MGNDYVLNEASVDSVGLSKEALPMNGSQGMRNRESGTQGNNMNNQWMKPKDIDEDPKSRSLFMSQANEEAKGPIPVANNMLG